MSAAPLPRDLVLEPVGRRPLRLADETVRTILDRPLPEAGAPARLATSAVSRLFGRAPAASVIIVTWEGLALTRLCLETLLAHTREPSFEVIVVDNASTDGTRAFLEALAAADARVRVILNGRNEGFAHACNQGARAARGGLLVFLNNDTVLPPDWLRGLAQHARRPGVGAVNPVTNRIGTEAEVPERSHTLGEFLWRAQRRRVLYAGTTRAVEMLALFCMAVRREVWDRVGALDESFGRGLFEDDDYSARLRAAGYRLVCAEDVLVHHLGEGSFGRLVPDGTYGTLFEQNRRRFEAKWSREWKRAIGRTEEPYLELVERIRAAVLDRVPPGATVAVVSRGDDALVDLSGPIGWHFPRAADGTWAGHYPENSTAAIAQLEEIRRAGADYLLLPQPAFWWLEHYRELGDHLHADEIACTPDLRLYRLSGLSRRNPSETRRVAGGMT